MSHAPRPSPTKLWLRALEATARIDRDGHTFPELIDDLATRQGDRPALLSEGECLTFRELAERSNRYSRWALSLDLPAGATVGLLMPNRPDYLAAWIGLTRVGLTAALLNTNLTGASLAHCIAVAAPAHVVVAGACTDAFAGAAAHLAAPPRAWLRQEGELDAALVAQPENGGSTRCRAIPSPRTSDAPWPCRTARSASTRRAPPACPRPPTSAIAAS